MANTFPVQIYPVPGLSATDCHSNPLFDIRVTHADVDADAPASLGYRPSAWQSDDFLVTNGGVGSSGFVSFGVSASGETLYRELTDNWLARNVFYSGPPCVAVAMPHSYFHHKQNSWSDTYGSPYQGYTSPDEDVTWYQSHRYLEIGLAPGGVPTEKNFQVTLYYKTETVADNYFDDATRTVVCSLSAEQSVTYMVTWDSNRLWVDLWKKDCPALEHITKIEIQFPQEALAWALTGMTLARHSDHDPHRAEVTPHGLVTVAEVWDRYMWRGLNAVMDGKCKQVLRTSGPQEHVYSGHEEVVEAVWRLITALTKTDASSAWTAANYCSILSNCCEGWTWQLPADWNALTIDAASGILTLGYSFDWVERQDYDVDAGTYPGGLTVLNWTPAKALLYKPHGVTVVQGGIHGMANRRSDCCGAVYNREAGSAAAWTLVDSPASDGHGYWFTGQDLLHHYTGMVPTYYEYRVNELPPEYDFNRLYRGQWEWDYLVIASAGKKCGVYTDRDGVTWYVWIAGNDILLKYMTAEYTTFSVAITVDSSGLYDMVDVHGDGRLLVVGARNSGTEAMYSFHSVDMGGTWSGPHLVG